jgi:PAS domain S-box-containing protein
MMTQKKRTEKTKPIGRKRIDKNITERKRAESALGALLAREEAILSAIPDIIMEVDNNKVYTWANEAGLAFFGKDVIGKEAAFYFEGEQNTYQTVQPVFTGSEKVIYVEGWQRRSDGQKRLLAWRCRTLKDESGNVKGALSIASDITERKRAEKELQAANQQLAASNQQLKATEQQLRASNQQLEAGMERLAEAQAIARLGSWEYDAVKDVISGSDEFYRQFGVGHDRLRTYQAFLDLLHPDDREHVGRDVQESLTKKALYDTEYRVRLPNGDYRDIHARGRVFADDAGKPVRMVGTCIDITERKRAEEELENRRNLLNETARMAKIGGWELDVATMKQKWTDETYAIHDREKGVYDPNSTEELSRFEPGSAELIGKAFQEALERGKPYDLEVEMKTIKGNFKWVRAVCNPIMVDGKVKTLKGAVQDITERKRAEEEIRTLNAELEQRVQDRTAELEMANKELEAFTYSISHDLRAPLRAVDGFSRILLDEFAPQLPPDVRRYLELVRSNTIHMGQLVDDLLKLSYHVRKTVIQENVKPVELVREALDLLRGEQEGRNVKITVGDLPTCQGDRALLKQVFVNLLSNALKFTRRRDPAIIEVGCIRKDGANVFFVRDNGVGFDMRYVGKLFGVFQRLHRPEDYEGTGVGLAIIERIVRRHGGRVWAEAEPDKGATFYFMLKGESPC